MRARLAVPLSTLFVSLLLLAWYFRSTKHASEPSASTNPLVSAAPSGTLSAKEGVSASSESAPTNLHAHNLMLRKGPDFRIYVRWLRGQMVRTHRDVNPSFDDPESFFLDIKAGVIRANIGDISNFLNASAIASSPLKNITISGDGDDAYCVQVVLITCSVRTRKSAVSRLPVLFCFCVSSPASPFSRSTWPVTMTLCPRCAFSSIFELSSP